MSRKWLKREGPEWVRAGILTEEQFGRIMARYPESDRRGQLLPILAAVLVGLGILSAVASNWDGIPPLARLAILMAAVAGFHAAGEVRTSRGFPHTGAALTGLGVIAFGAGMVLVGQMFHLTAFDARLFILWGLAALAVLVLYRHPALFLLAFVILTAAQLYSVASFGRFSWVTALLFIAGLIPDAQRRPAAFYRWLAGAGIVFQAAAGIYATGDSFLWTVTAAAGVYTLADCLPSGRWSRPLQVPALTVGFAVSLYWFHLSPRDAREFDIVSVPDWRVMGPVILLLLAASLWAKVRRRSVHGAFDWLLFIPWYLLTQAIPPGVHTVWHLLILYAFATHVLVRGFSREARDTANTGIVLFLLITVNAYFNLAWDFLPKSVFFLLGGLLLFGLNALLQRQKRVSLSGGGDAR